MSAANERMSGYEKNSRTILKRNRQTSPPRRRPIWRRRTAPITWLHTATNTPSRWSRPSPKRLTDRRPLIARIPRPIIPRRKMRLGLLARSRRRSKPFCNPLYFPRTQSCQIGPCRQGFHERKPCALDWRRPDLKKPLVLFKRKMEVLKTLYKEGQSRSLAAKVTYDRG